MKPAGYLCNIDALGRIVVPKQLRTQFGLDKGVTLELFTTENQIIMAKYNNRCIFCEKEDNLTEYNGKHICDQCLSNIRKAK